MIRIWVLVIGLLYVWVQYGPNLFHGHAYFLRSAHQIFLRAQLGGVGALATLGSTDTLNLKSQGWILGLTCEAKVPKPLNHDPWVCKCWQFHTSTCVPPHPHNHKQIYE